jgi:hypothetical protein
MVNVYQVGIILIKIGDYALHHKESIDADRVRVILRRTNEHSILRRDSVDLGDIKYKLEYVTYNLLFYKDLSLFN